MIYKIWLFWTEVQIGFEVLVFGLAFKMLKRRHDHRLIEVWRSLMFQVMEEIRRIES